MNLNFSDNNTNTDDMSGFPTGLDSDTDWMGNLGLGPFMPYDMGFSSIFRLPASH